MRKSIKKLYIGTTALPMQEPVYERLYPIVKKRIEDRCGTVCGLDI